MSSARGECGVTVGGVSRQFTTLPLRIRRQNFTAALCANFDRERAPKKRNFLVKQNIQKTQQRNFWPVFFTKKMAAAQKVWSKKGPFSDLGDLKKPFDRPEKKVNKIF